jgi:hypothetical protein
MVRQRLPDQDEEEEPEYDGEEPEGEEEQIAHSGLARRASAQSTRQPWQREAESYGTDHEDEQARQTDTLYPNHCPNHVALPTAAQLILARMSWTIREIVWAEREGGQWQLD